MITYDNQLVLDDTFNFVQPADFIPAPLQAIDLDDIFPPVLVQFEFQDHGAPTPTEPGHLTPDQIDYILSDYGSGPQNTGGGDDGPIHRDWIIE